MSENPLAILVGNLQRASPNRKLAEHIIRCLAGTRSAKIVEIGQLPLYNEDLEADPPEPWRRFRERIAQSSAIVFVTPEHLASVPAVLMNALDVGSMPRDRNIWDHKPVAIAGVSTGMIGVFNGHRHLRKVMSNLKADVMAKPRLYLTKPDSCNDEAGQYADSGTRQLIERFLTSFDNWVTDHE